MNGEAAHRPGTVGQCDCGAVEFHVPSPPARVKDCHCGICRRYGTLWAYYPVDEVSLTGATEIYVRGDRTIAFHRCRTCGCVMAWLPLDDWPRCGINARMIEGFDSRLAEIEISEGPA